MIRSTLLAPMLPVESPATLAMAAQGVPVSGARGFMFTLVSGCPYVFPLVCRVTLEAGNRVELLYARPGVFYQYDSPIRSLVCLPAAAVWGHSGWPHAATLRDPGAVVLFDSVDGERDFVNAALPAPAFPERVVFDWTVPAAADASTYAVNFWRPPGMERLAIWARQAKPLVAQVVKINAPVDLDEDPAAPYVDNWLAGTANLPAPTDSALRWLPVAYFGYQVDAQDVGITASGGEVLRFKVVPTSRVKVEIVSGSIAANGLTLRAIWSR